MHDYCTRLVVALAARYQRPAIVDLEPVSERAEEMGKEKSKIVSAAQASSSNDGAAKNETAENEPKVQKVDSPSTSASAKNLSSQVKDREVQIQATSPIKSLSWKRYNSQRMPGTCYWIQGHESFKAWLDGDRRLLTLQGASGTGKSVLASAIAEELNNLVRQTKGTDKPVAVISLFLGFCSELSTKDQVLRSALEQAYSAYREHRQACGDDPLPAESSVAPDEMLERLKFWLPSSGRTYIILDGLEEEDLTKEGEDSVLHKVQPLLSLYFDPDHQVHILLTTDKERDDQLEPFLGRLGLPWVNSDDRFQLNLTVHRDNHDNDIKQNDIRGFIHKTISKLNCYKETTEIDKHSDLMATDIHRLTHACGGS